jgi:hypothetical protein
MTIVKRRRKKETNNNLQNTTEKINRGIETGLRTG